MRHIFDDDTNITLVSSNLLVVPNASWTGYHLESGNHCDSRRTPRRDSRTQLKTRVEGAAVGQLSALTAQTLDWSRGAWLEDVTREFRHHKRLHSIVTAARPTPIGVSAEVDHHHTTVDVQTVARVAGSSGSVSPTSQGYLVSLCPTFQNVNNGIRCLTRCAFEKPMLNHQRQDSGSSFLWNS